MLEWLGQIIVKHTLGYAIGWHRSRLKVSLATHIEQSWSDRSIHMSITNEGNSPIIVDSWTVHMPLEELLPGVAKRVVKPEPTRPKRISSIRRFAVRIRRLLYKENHIADKNELSRLLARSALNEPHGRHELLDPGTRQRIEAGESAVRSFPRTSAIRGKLTITPNTQCLTIIPSCHVVGHRRRIWGFPSYLSSGPILVAAQLNPPRIDDQD